MMELENRIDGLMIGGRIMTGNDIVEQIKKQIESLKDEEKIKILHNQEIELADELRNLNDLYYKLYELEDAIEARLDERLGKIKGALYENGIKLGPILNGNPIISSDDNKISIVMSLLEPNIYFTYMSASKQRIYRKVIFPSSCKEQIVYDIVRMLLEIYKKFYLNLT